MRILKHTHTKLFLLVTTLIIALCFVLDLGVSVTSSALQRPRLPLSQSLTGTWISETKGTYYVRQVDNTVWWVGQSQDGGVSFTNVFNGTRSGDQVTGFWADVPAGRNMGSGSLTLSISGTGAGVEIRKVHETGGFGEGLWKRANAGPPPPTEQPQPPPPPTPGFCTVVGRVTRDRPAYATRIRLYRPDGSETRYLTSVQGEQYRIARVPEGTYEVRGRGNYPTSGSGRMGGLGIFTNDEQTIKCEPGATITVNFVIRSTEG